LANFLTTQALIVVARGKKKSQKGNDGAGKAQLRGGNEYFKEKKKKT